METNWSVVYNADKPWKVPGPFEKCVVAGNAHALSFVLAHGCLREDKSPFVYIAENMTFHPAPPPQEALVHVGPILRRIIQVKRQLTCYGDDTPLFAAVGRAILAGPKLFRPTARQCEPLEQVEIGLTAAQISLPYPVCVVEFPSDYATDRIVPSPNDAELVRPGFVVAVQENDVLVVTLVLPETSNGNFYDFMCLPVNKSTVEVVLERAGERGAAFSPCVRAALNFLMIAADSDRLISTTNTDQLEHLQKRIKRAKKLGHKDKYQELRDRRRRLPIYHTLSQEIKLFKQKPPPVDPNPDAVGTLKKPHWRKGHWKMVMVGVGRKEPKHVFIKPVFVNGHLLPGK